MNPYESPLTPPPKAKKPLFRVVRGLLYPLMVPAMFGLQVWINRAAVNWELAANVMGLIACSILTGALAAFELLD